jgi:glycosyltransferase involved in cell wall biosynthesis
LPAKANCWKKQEHSQTNSALNDMCFSSAGVKESVELLSVSYACVLSSIAEGFSNSILEYMAAGRPVVATDVGGAREAVVEGENGYLVKAGDDQSLAQRLTELLNSPTRAAAMGERGREIVREKFSSEAQLARAENLYETLLGREEYAPVSAAPTVRRGDA